MTDLRLVPYFILLCLPCSIVLGQTNVYYTAYRSSFAVVTTCGTNQYYDIALLQCSPCPTNTIQKTTGQRREFRTIDGSNTFDLDQTQCECNDASHYYAVNQEGGSLLCQPCPTGNVCVRILLSFYRLLVCRRDQGTVERRIRMRRE